MTDIKLVREPAGLSGGGMGLECCIFCKKTTSHWHEETDNPVCPACAKKETVESIRAKDEKNPVGAPKKPPHLVKVSTTVRLLQAHKDHLKDMGKKDGTTANGYLDKLIQADIERRGL